MENMKYFSMVVAPPPLVLLFLLPPSILDNGDGDVWGLGVSAMEGKDTVIRVSQSFATTEESRTCGLVLLTYVCTGRRGQ